MTARALELLRRHGLVVALVGLLVAAVGWLVLFLAAQPAGLQVLWTARVIAFGVGLVVVPGLAYAALVPGVAAAPMVRLWGAVATLSRPVTRFWIDASGEYHAERSEAPEGTTYNFLYGTVWFDWAREDECLPEHAVEQIDTGSILDDGDSAGGLPGEKAAYGPERGGHQTYIRTDWSAGRFIQVGEVLEDFRDRALELINNVQDYALREHGGDTSGHSAKVVLTGVVTMALMGMLMGYVVYF